jgi:hypothetical protein
MQEVQAVYLNPLDLFCRGSHRLFTVPIRPLDPPRHSEDLSISGGLYCLLSVPSLPAITNFPVYPQGGHLSQEEVQHVLIVAWKQKLQSLKEADAEVEPLMAIVSCQVGCGTHPPAVASQMRQHTAEMEASGTALYDGQPHMMQHAHATDAWGEWHMFGVIIGMAITELGPPLPPPPPPHPTPPPVNDISSARQEIRLE